MNNKHRPNRPFGTVAAKKYLSILAASAVLLTLLITINELSFPLAFLFAFMSFFLVFAVRALLESSTRAYWKKRREEDLAGFLYRAVYYKSKSGSYLRAVDKAVQGTPEGDVKRISARASRSLQLGGGFLPKMVSGDDFREGELLEGLRFEGADGTSQMLSALAAHEAGIGGRRSALEESSQRYATINMFISTIAPSFLIFGFIGTAIMSPVGFSLLLFSVSLLIFIPLSYSIGNSFLSRRMYA